MRATIRRVLGLAALCAAARVAWLHHRDNELVKRTDREREVFAAGQEAERRRRTAQEASARAWLPAGPMPSWLVATAKEHRAKHPRLLPGGTVEWQELDFVERDLGAMEEPEGPGWLEFGGTQEDPDRDG